MDPARLRPQPSTSSFDRLLGVSTFSPSAVVNTYEFNEAELLWSGDVAERENRPPISSTENRKNSASFGRPQNSGIIDLLFEHDHHTGDVSMLSRKSAISSFSSASKAIPPVGRPLGQNPQDAECFSKSVPGRKFQQSAPVKVPVLSSKAMAGRRNGELGLVDDDDEDDDEMLPPHEIVARGSGVSPKTTFSVLEGVGRTLKGRDLRQVRNAIWRKTGFLD